MKQRSTPSWRFIGMVTLLLIAPTTMSAESYQLVPRWGAASAYVSSPPSVLIQGGKVDSTDFSSYASGVNSADLITIPLDASFDVTSPPVSQLSFASAGPPYAFHTLSTGDENSSLLFGGDSGGSEPVETSATSVWLLNSTGFTHEPEAWGSQPIRRIYHSAVSSGGTVYITGGLKNDGSGQAFSDTYAFDSSSQVFTPMPPLPSGLYHHTTALLPNGTLLVVGGVAISTLTGNPSAIDMSTVYTFDTIADGSVWEERSLVGNPPTGRRGATLVLNDAGDQAFLYGGADAGLSQAMADGWKLDLTGCTWSQVLSSDGWSS
ncbi:hypothetical protein BD324DRAFT_251312 [Kockovaella imperatae]|uniref:Galactose oxidase n=1 Tax=Kockovaella imperatae TaxID=4999 RepID=A0A1Y1UPP2_9TREE|nr:hypothetical protein BD324DRAFT_251312 [Kockovaella imperatae]ORX40028.1 hypothetical protein BD324DRAFT_251312 [Kockovaella imperatae]